MNLINYFKKLCSSYDDTLNSSREKPENDEITKHKIKELLNIEEPVIVEIGCNDGSHTKWFKEMFSNPSIFCFEPDERAIRRFESNVGSRANRGNVELIKSAVGKDNGFIEFYQSDGHRNENQKSKFPDGWDFSGSIRKPKLHLKKHPWVEFNDVVSVPVTTLDSWCEQNNVGNIDFMWMDVQGAEMDVFQGARRTLDKVRYIFTEYSDEELYEGQAPLQTILDYLKDFEIDTKYSKDVLLYNKKLV